MAKKSVPNQTSIVQGEEQLVPVIFHGDTIFCVTIDEQPFTPVKPIVENMGLDWRTQQRKLSDNAARWGMVIMTIPTESGEQQMLCLPVRKLPAYLASINPKKVRAELRPKIELYQAESDDALWAYWIKGRAERKGLPAAPVKSPYEEAEDRLEKMRCKYHALRDEAGELLVNVLMDDERRMPRHLLVKMPTMLIEMTKTFFDCHIDIHQSHSSNPVPLIRELHQALGLKRTVPLAK